MSITVLLADDQEMIRTGLRMILSAQPGIEVVGEAADGAEAVALARQLRPDVCLFDIRMPGLDGLDLARVLRRFASPPAVVFVSAYDSHAVEAFDLRAVDYVMKPVREERLTEAVRRVDEARALAATPSAAAPAAADDESIAVELAGVTRFVKRSDVRYVEAHGDYARLVTDEGRHLVRVSLAHLEEEWADAGFVRIHRRWLVSLAAIDEVRSDGGRMSLRVGDAVLPVSRRHTRELRDRLVRSARPGRA